jgi:hypothetical protein
VIALSTVSILSLTVTRTIKLADQDIIRKVTAEHRLRKGRAAYRYSITEQRRSPSFLEARQKWTDCNRRLQAF